MSRPAAVQQIDDSANEEKPVPLLGSACWAGFNTYNVGSVAGRTLRHRATKFFAAVEWDALAHLSSGLRNGIPCRFEGSFAIGYHNMVRHIVFEDGINWVARLRLPRLESVSPVNEMLEDARALKIEIATMKFIKAKTSIAVPEVHGYNIYSCENVGASYILMDYIHGTVAKELRELKNCDAGLFGTPSQDRNFKRQMASIQAELSSHKFDQIGSLHQDAQTLDFFIGPDIETVEGPWTSSMDYFTDLANHMLAVCKAKAGLEVRSGASGGLPVIFKQLIPWYCHVNPEGSFSLTNRNFGAHNILVNDDFEIVGVIDFDGVMAAPMEVVSQYPQFTGLDWEPSRRTETDSLAIERIRGTQSKLEEYKNFLEIAEIRFNCTYGSDREAPIANMMLSNGASLFRGLWEYRRLNKSVNDMWMAYYMILLRPYLSRDRFQDDAFAQ